jgi:hypothetical protein
MSDNYVSVLTGTGPFLCVCGWSEFWNQQMFVGFTLASYQTFICWSGILAFPLFPCWNSALVLISMSSHTYYNSLFIIMLTFRTEWHAQSEMCFWNINLQEQWPQQLSERDCSPHILHTGRLTCLAVLPFRCIGCSSIPLTDTSVWTIVYIRPSACHQNCSCSVLYLRF